MNPTNKLLLLRTNYDSEASFFDAVGKAVAELIKNNQMVVSHRVERNGQQIVLEYLPLDFSGAVAAPYWLYPDEADYVREYVEEVHYQMLLEELDRYESPAKDEADEKNIKA